MKHHAKRRQRRTSERTVRQSQSDAEMLIALFATIVTRALHNMATVADQATATTHSGS
jgi:hypothetical protein